jgi:hypothetical protein
MIVKPSISFLSTDSDPQLVTRTGGILAAMTGNVHYPAPTPPLADVQAALDAFTTALANAAGGGPTLTSLKNDRRAALANQLRLLASYVQVACLGDLTILLSSGFPIQKPQREPIGVLPAPAGLTVTLGARSGELDANAAPVWGAGIYNWRLTTAAAPAVVLQSPQTTGASNTFAGLTPGVVYNIQVNAVGASGPSDWSDPVPQMAI